VALSTYREATGGFDAPARRFHFCCRGPVIYRHSQGVSRKPAAPIPFVTPREPALVPASHGRAVNAETDNPTGMIRPTLDPKTDTL